ncbi:translocation/assembly module TamB domain-containing protein [Qipengyuania nanhaisediminis]|uniref:translocation/assembly module TamB domain-containing protein n=1 Tax=Qipengyuania nanhaisediminis TaxID=604088 RepID=UPI0038B35674
MTDALPDTASQPDPVAKTAPRKRKRRWAKRLGWALAIIVTPFVLIALFLSTPIGKRFITDQIAAVSPASGLRFEVGRIEGDIYGRSTLHDVTVMDPEGVFLTIPEVELDWRPLSWITSGIDVRELTARRGTLERLPELLPGDPDAPVLPDFDIRVDRFVIDNLTLAAGLAGDEEQRVDLAARVDIRSGRALVDAEGTFGREDRLDLLLDAEPDGDRFDLALDIAAASDGPTVALAGLDKAYRIWIEGDGSWSDWDGHALVTRQDGDTRERVAGFRLANDAGRYSAIGQVSPELEAGSLPARAIGSALSLVVEGTLEQSVFDGAIAAVSPALNLRGRGAVDLAGNTVEDFDITGRLRDPGLFGESFALEGARFSASVTGPFRDLVIAHDIDVATLVAAGGVSVDGLAQQGTATFDGETWRVPLDLRAARVTTGNAFADPRLVDGTLSGLLTYSGGRIEADNARLAFDGLGAQLSLRGNTATGAYALAGPVTARGLALEDLGSVNANAKIVLTFGAGAAWNLNANLSGVLHEVENATIANLAGNQVRFDGGLSMGGERPIVLRDVVIASDKLDARLDSRIAGGVTTLAGSGNHAQYGAFTFDAEVSGDGPRATLVLADPYPSAGLEDVRVTIAPSGDGFALAVAGGSLLGPFEGALGIVLPADGPTQIAIARLEVYRTNVTGSLALGDSEIAGDLALSGGGLDGTISLSPAAGGAQAFAVDLQARQARFGGDTRIALAYADIEASGRFDGNSSRIEADIAGTGLEYGALSIAAFDAEASIVDGRGALRGAIAGRRADRFQLKFEGNFSPERIALIAQGEYGGRAISMPRRAVLTPLEDGGYRLAPTQIGFARGFAIFEGTFGGDATAVSARLNRMPLRLADLAGSELGLGGRLSGIINWTQPSGGLPTGNARIRVDDFTRSGLVLSSQPIDLFAVIDLSPDALRAGARIREDQADLGRIDARITRLPRSGDLAARLNRGRLDARLEYDGDAAAIWRLAAIETFDLVGPVDIAARATGTLANPRINGTLASNDLRLQSAIAGTDIDNITARGRFAGSRLEIARFAGTTRGGGTVSGSGFVDLANMSATRGPRIDIRAAAKDARLLNANGLDATITGPLRLVSNGVGGAIAGRVTIDEASWALGVAGDDMALPQIATREINRRDTVAATTSGPAGAWRYLVNASAPSRVSVDGMGLESEWGIDIALRGTVDDPRIGGEARLVRGDYTFAGTRFELTDGRIEFDQDMPIDPRLDIEAQASANGTEVTIDITGNAQSPEIAFSSVPALPEEEILSQLLFGGSVTSLSATDAVQLGAALASLRGGGSGLDPIGTLRRSIGLDQLRIVSADPALGRGTGVALGKNIGSDVYVELVTDGQGYSATQVEYRISSWLALLATISTVGRDSVLAEISRDY